MARMQETNKKFQVRHHANSTTYRATEPIVESTEKILRSNGGVPSSVHHPIDLQSTNRHLINQISIHTES